MCSIDGCARSRAAYSNFCDYHRRHDRRHGHPLQTGCRAAELGPFIKQVRRYLAERSGPGVDQAIQQIWVTLVREAQELRHLWDRGRPGNKYQMAAAEVVLQINHEHEPRKIAEFTMAIGFWLRWEPSRFRSDKAFQFQAARMFRRLAPMAVGYSWDDAGNCQRSHYKDTPPATTRATWEILKRSKLIDYGWMIANEIIKEKEMKRRSEAEERIAILGPLAANGGMA